MRIICTVKEFGQIVRGCEKRSCYQCPLEEVCSDSEGCGIEQFISAADVVAGPEDEGRLCRDLEYRGGYQPTKAPERLIPPVGSGGEDG